MQGDNGLMHESNDVNDPRRLTRPLFQWANTMLVVYYEQTFGRSCSQVGAVPHHCLFRGMCEQGVLDHGIGNSLWT